MQQGQQSTNKESEKYFFNTMNHCDFTGNLKSSFFFFFTCNKYDHNLPVILQLIHLQIFNFSRLRPVTNLGLCESLPTKKSMEQITMFGKNDPCNIEGHSCKGKISSIPYQVIVKYIFCLYVLIVDSRQQIKICLG